MMGNPRFQERCRSIITVSYQPTRRFYSVLAHGRKFEEVHRGTDEFIHFISNYPFGSYTRFGEVQRHLRHSFIAKVTCTDSLVHLRHLVEDNRRDRDLDRSILAAKQFEKRDTRQVNQG